MPKNEFRLDATEPNPEPKPESRRRPILCRIPAGTEDLEHALEGLSQALSGELGEEPDCDLYDLAYCLYELGLQRPAISLLEHELRTRGFRVGACELMGRCLVTLGRPELALPWFVRVLREADLDSDGTFEVIRLASLCRMQIDDLAESQDAWQRAA